MPRPSNFRIQTILTVILLSAAAHAGGPRYVAGVSTFDPSATGKPIVWANGDVQYYTDPGDLSPVLLHAAADALVADSFSRWTAVPTAALKATRAGALAEDVSGANVLYSDNTLQLPADIRTTAIAKPIAIVYDADGRVTDALLGGGASDPLFCRTNSVTGSVDAFDTSGVFAHAMLVLNGRCAATSAAVTRFQYRLVRKLGQTLGLDWSQANDHVVTGTRPASAEDLQGYPVMHPVEMLCLLPQPDPCLADAMQLRADDRAALAALYPVTAANQAQFPGKTQFQSTTGTITGSVYFSLPDGSAGQPMQGVNLVARLIDPATGQPSGKAVRSGVSGSRFRGRAGNPVSGFIGPKGLRYDALGGAASALEGYFELSGLELPTGYSQAQYRVELEPVNPLYTGEQSVGPYSAGQVFPSGTLPTFTVVLSAGDAVSHDVVLADSVHQARGRYGPNSFAQPFPVPASGEWWDSFSGYGNADYFGLKVRANRSFDLRLWALDDNLHPATNKAMPEIGVWIAGDLPSSAPRVDVSSFNTFVPGLTSLSAGVGSDQTLIFGLTDLRGDGRPDFRYRARLLYADAVSPARVNGPGSLVEITGVGLRPGMAVRMNGVPAAVYAADQSHVLALVPAGVANTVADLTLTDPSSLAVSQMFGALQVGAVAGDTVAFVTQGLPPAPVGSSVVLRVKVTDGSAQPVANESVTFSVSPQTSSFTACVAAACTLQTNAAGIAEVVLKVAASGTNTVTAALANGQSAVTTVPGSIPASAVVPQPGDLYVPAGADLIIPLTALWLVNGQPTAGHNIKFDVTSASGSGSATIASDASGLAKVNLQVFGFADVTTATICAIEGSPCATMHIYPVAAANLRLSVVTGDAQVLSPGQTPLPLGLQVTDNSSPANRVFGAAVSYSIAVLPPAAVPDCALPEGGCHMSDTKVLTSFQGNVISDLSGGASLAPPLQASWGQARVLFLVGLANSTAAPLSATWRIIASAP